MESYVSLATNDEYCQGALALAQSLRNTGTGRTLTLLITAGVSPAMRGRVECLWDQVVEVEQLDTGDSAHLSLLARPELGVTLSKLHAWRLTQFSKCVFLDADTLVLSNVDDLFSREELSAAPDIGWPDCFNSGVFVFRPSVQTFTQLLDLAASQGSFDGGDQGLLNTYWSDWATADISRHLPFSYNVTPNISYGYTPAFKRFESSIKIIHFIGAVKPWAHRYLDELQTLILAPGSHSSSEGARDYLTMWWQVFRQSELHEHVQGGVPTTPISSPHSYTSSPHKPTSSPSPTSSPHIPTHHIITCATTSQMPSTLTLNYHAPTSSSHTPSLPPTPSFYAPSYSTHPSYYSVPPISSVASSLPSTPPSFTYSHADTHSHTSLSFFVPDDLVDMPPDEATSITRRDYLYNDYEDFPSLVSKRLKAILLDDYSTHSPFIHTPTSFWGSHDITLPGKTSQSDHSFVVTTGSDFDSSDDELDPVPTLISPPPSHTHPPLKVEGHRSSPEIPPAPAEVVKSVEQTQFERGLLDLNGSDSFASIQAHIDSMMDQDSID